MNKLLFSLAALFLMHSAMGQKEVNPEIAPYGTVSVPPGVSFHADKKLEYKIVLEVSKSDTPGTEISQSMETVSRLVNLLALDGIGKEKRKIVVIFHNMGAYAVQTQEAYQRKYGAPNPNLDAIEKLAAAGVEFLVCGQSTVRRHILQGEIAPQVKTATSYLTAFTTLQLKGYSGLHL